MLDAQEYLQFEATTPAMYRWGCPALVAVRGRHGQHLSFPVCLADGGTSIHVSSELAITEGRRDVPEKFWPSVTTLFARNLTANQAGVLVEHARNLRNIFLSDDEPNRALNTCEILKERFGTRLSALGIHVPRSAHAIAAQWLSVRNCRIETLSLGFEAGVEEPRALAKLLAHWSSVKALQLVCLESAAPRFVTGRKWLADYLDALGSSLAGPSGSAIETLCLTSQRWLSALPLGLLRGIVRNGSPNLRHLALGQFVVGEDAGRELQRLVAGPQFQSLELRGCNFDSTDLLERLLESGQGLESLAITQPQVSQHAADHDDEARKAASPDRVGASAVQGLELNGSKLGKFGTARAMELLGVATTHLDLANVNFDPVVLARHLPKIAYLDSIRHLNISGAYQHELLRHISPQTVRGDFVRVQIDSDKASVMQSLCECFPKGIELLAIDCREFTSAEWALVEKLDVRCITATRGLEVDTNVDLPTVRQLNINGTVSPDSVRTLKPMFKNLKYVVGMTDQPWALVDGVTVLSLHHLISDYPSELIDSLNLLPRSARAKSDD